MRNASCAGQIAATTLKIRLGGMLTSAEAIWSLTNGRGLVCPDDCTCQSSTMKMRRRDETAAKSDRTSVQAGARPAASRRSRGRA